MEEGIVLGERSLHNQAFHKIANTKTIIPLYTNKEKEEGLFYLEISPVSKDFNIIQLKSKGMGNAAKYQSYTRPKFIKQVNKIVQPKGKNLLKPKAELPKEQRVIEV